MIFKKHTFTDELVNLDDNQYTKCTFDRCEIVYSGGGLPKLAENNFKDCAYTFDGAASRTISFMTNLYSGGGHDIIENTVNNIMGKGPGGIKMH